MEKKIKKQIGRFIEEQDLSCVISIDEENENVFHYAGGLRDRKNRLKNNLETQFALASGAKTFTAVAILSLVENGDCSLDDDINQFLDSSFNLEYPGVKIKHLLNHSSGILDYLDEEKDADLSHIPWNNLLKPMDYFLYFPKGELEFEPGTRFKYNNGAYVILAHIIDILKGDFYNYIHQLLKNIKLNNTKYFRFDQLPENAAIGYTEKKDNVKSNINDLPIIGSGDGGIYSTLKDIALFWDQLFSYNIISRELMHLMISPQIHVKDQTYYGYGLWIRKSIDGYQYEMVGCDIGVSFVSVFNKDMKKTITIISNNDKDVWKLKDHLIKLEYMV
jgi:CubicO group peptidase (beta-lactamase class C family)